MNAYSPKAYTIPGVDSMQADYHTPTSPSASASGTGRGQSR